MNENSNKVINSIFADFQKASYTGGWPEVMPKAPKPKKEKSENEWILLAHSTWFNKQKWLVSHESEHRDAYPITQMVPYDIIQLDTLSVEEFEAEHGYKHSVYKLVKRYMLLGREII